MPMTMLLSVLLHLSPAWGAPHPVEEVSVSEASAPVLLNDATSDQLASLDGVAEADARAIVALREDRGGLSSVEELRVLGLGEPVLASLRSQTALEVRIRPPERDMAFSSASEVLEKGALVITPRGERYTQNNIRQRLQMRDFMETMRASGEHTGGPPPLNQTDRKAFADQLDRILTRAQQA